MTERILCVDDEPNVLAATRRTLRRMSVDVETAECGDEALVMVRDSGPYAVVLADMRMPGMSGVDLLVRLQDLAPQSVRMMLTGNTDLDTAIQAVNCGQIFRFLLKPCSSQDLVDAVEAGLRQHRLITAEQTMLQDTLNASIQVLTDVLSLANPVAFGYAARLRQAVRHVVAELGLPNAWQYEAAAMLSQIGWVALPSEILEKVSAGLELTEAEKSLAASFPAEAANLLADIPRLEEVVGMIRAQGGHRDDDVPPAVAWGGHILRAASVFDRMLLDDKSRQDAVAELRRRQDIPAEIIDALAKADVRLQGAVVRSLKATQLGTHMILEDDIRAANGNLVVGKHQELTVSVLHLLRRWTQGIGLREPIRVRVPCAEVVAAVHSGE